MAHQQKVTQQRKYVALRLVVEEKGTQQRVRQGVSTERRLKSGVREFWQ